MLTDDTVLDRAPDVRGTDLADLVVLSTSTEQYVGLRDVGARVWAHLAEPIALRDLVASLAEEHGADPAHVREDVVPFLEQLVERGLVRTG